jgi:sugar phosphate isomerase/epimerase
LIPAVRLNLGDAVRYSLHSVSLWLCNNLVDIQVARAAGFDGLDMRVPKLERYLTAGYQTADLLPAIGPLDITMLSALEGFEEPSSAARQVMRQRCHAMCQAAVTLRCPTIQVIALDGLKAEPWPRMRAGIAQELGVLADIAAGYGIKLALEAVAVAEVHTLQQAREIVEEAGCDNLGILLDTFHLYAGGTTWDEVAQLDGRLVLGAHIGEATTPRGPHFTDLDRGALPGDGILPFADAIGAIRATGYTGIWSMELYSPYHWEWEPLPLAQELHRRMVRLLGH